MNDWLEDFACTAGVGDDKAVGEDGEVPPEGAFCVAAIDGEPAGKAEGEVVGDTTGEDFGVIVGPGDGDCAGDAFGDGDADGVGVGDAQTDGLLITGKKRPCKTFPLNKK